MSTKPNEDQILIRKKEANPSDFPEMSKEYYSAHRNLALFSALLLAWELVGVELKDLPYASFKSPEAPPYVLCVLIIYFWYRMAMEYGQCHQERRNHRLAKVDYFLTQGIASISLGLLIYQRLTKSQFLSSFWDRALPFDSPWQLIGLGAVFGFMFRYSIGLLRFFSYLSGKSRSDFWVGTTILFFSLPMIIRELWHNFILMFVGLMFGYFAFKAINVGLSMWRKRPPKPANEKKLYERILDIWSTPRP